MDLENPLLRSEPCLFGVDLVLGIESAGGFMGVEWVLRRRSVTSCEIRLCVGLLLVTFVHALPYFLWRLLVVASLRGLNGSGCGVVTFWIVVDVVVGFVKGFSNGSVGWDFGLWLDCRVSAAGAGV